MPRYVAATSAVTYYQKYGESGCTYSTRKTYYAAGLNTSCNYYGTYTTTSGTDKTYYQQYGTSCTKRSYQAAQTYLEKYGNGCGSSCPKLTKTYYRSAMYPTSYRSTHKSTCTAYFWKCNAASSTPSQCPGSTSTCNCGGTLIGNYASCVRYIVGSIAAEGGSISGDACNGGATRYSNTCPLNYSAASYTCSSGGTCKGSSCTIKYSSATTSSSKGCTYYKKACSTSICDEYMYYCSKYKTKCKTSSWRWDIFFVPYFYLFV